MNNKKLLTGLGVVVTILSIIGGIWAFDAHYATDKKVDDLEIQIAGALQNQQMKSDYQFYQFMYDKLTQDIYNLKRQIRNAPWDGDLKQDYKEVIQERKEIKRKMDKAIKNIRIQ